MRFLWKSLKFGYLLVVLLTLLTYVASFVPPVAGTGFMAIGGLCFPYLFILHLIVFGWLVLRRSRYAWYALATLTLGIPFLLRNVNWHELPSNDRSTLSISTFNAQGLTLEQTENLDSAFRLIRHYLGNADVFALQEINHRFVKDLAVTNEYPHYIAHPRASTTLMSRHPFTEHGTVRFDSTGNSCLWVDLATPDGPLRVYNVHLESNRVSPEIGRLFEEGGDPRRRSTWRRIRNILRDFSFRATRRTEQIMLLKEHMRGCPHPIVLAGDLNDTPQSYTYRQLKLFLNDGFVQAGRGLAHSYAGPVPLLRIDYIFASPDLEFTRYRTVRALNSDHYPVRADLILKSNASPH